MDPGHGGAGVTEDERVDEARVAPPPREVAARARHEWSRLVEHVRDPALPPTPQKRAWWALHGVGMLFAVLFYTWSMTPSLLPRPWYLQGVATGICVALGYGVGVLVAGVVRRLGFSPEWSDRTRLWGWVALAGLAAIELPLFMVLGARWQETTRELVGVQEESGWFTVLLLPIAAGLALVLVALGRLVLRTGYRIARFVSRLVPVVVARLVGLVAALVITVILLQDGVVAGILAVGGRAAATRNLEDPPGVVRPQVEERSGSDLSPVEWEDLGREGRAFVSGGPSAAEIEAFSGEAALTPIRVYAGLGSAPTIEEIAATVVDELERTGGFDREVLAVATTTGTGWIDESMARPLEYLHGGDTAIAGMQYSYLPSGFAFLADRSTPKTAGQALFTAVYARWSTLPEDDRPRLVVMGESLGSYGGGSAFSGVQDMVARTDGALWVGTPNFAEPWGVITDTRDPGSPERLPVVDGGEHARFADSSADLAPDASWSFPRIVFLQHATDPVVWWSSDLLLRQPDWLREPRAETVNPAMSWYPFVTFWQVTVDLAFSVDVPDGYGHRYELANTDAWAAIVPPDGWTAQDTTDLREHLASEESE